MSMFYRIAYSVGFKPWERVAEADPATLPRMFAREEAERGGPGKALDIGCGSGAHTVELAERGWAATGVDVITKAVAQAERRIAAARSTATVVQADITKLHAVDIGSGFDFFLDRGCFHGLTEAQRASMGRAVTALAAPGATLLVFVFAPGTFPRPIPDGASQTDLETAFLGWTVVDSEPASTAGMIKPLRKSAPMWYRLRYQSPPDSKR